MDSENEVIVVDENVTTNGLNGHSEELGEMKTRSKTSEADVVKSKVRSARNVGGQDKAGSDTEKKEKKVAEGKPPVAQEKTAGATAVKKSAAAKANDEPSAGAVVLPAKKRNVEREDDSGINSRASSVSNDDATPRMRTRSSRSSDIASTSTPAKKGQGRMPLSTYDFEDVSFDDELLSPGSLKRKADMIVEEMEEIDEEREPPAKRPALAASTNFFNALFNPLRALRGKFTFKRTQPADASEAPAAKETPSSSSSDEGSASATTKMNVADSAASSKENVISQPETSAEQSESPDPSQTCRIM